MRRRISGMSEIVCCQFRLSAPPPLAKGPYYLELVSAVHAQPAGTATERTSTPACMALPWIEDKLLGVIHTALAFIIYGSAKLWGNNQGTSWGGPQVLQAGNHTFCWREWQHWGHVQLLGNHTVYYPTRYDVIFIIIVLVLSMWDLHLWIKILSILEKSQTN